jgi:hypothetical protein
VRLGSSLKAPVGWFEEAPRTLQAFIAFSLVWGVVFQLLTGFSHVPLWLLGLVGDILFGLMLLRRWRWVWWLLVIGGVLELVTAPVSSTPWWSLAATTVIYLPLLLAPATRRFIFKSRPRSDPSRMRYWHAEDGWMGTTKAPRRVRRKWRARNCDRL